MCSSEPRSILVISRADLQLSVGEDRSSWCDSVVFDVVERKENSDATVHVPLFMDVHNKVEGLTAEAVADAHCQDLAIQDQHGVEYHRYWFNSETGRVFCLVEAPNKEAAERVHREAHGLVADELIEVHEGS